jgi:uncharacterized protein with NRDE domain
MRSLIAGADYGPDGSFPEMGTWLGVNEAGMAVAVTNRHDSALAPAEQLSSRGLLAVALLESRSPESAVATAQKALARGGFGGCNFLVADRSGAFVVEAPGTARISVRKLDPGVHAMTNLDLDADDPRINLVRATLDPRHFVASASALCRDHRIVVAGAERGTVSSSLILADQAIILYHIQGIPSGRDYQQFDLFEHDHEHARNKN